MATAVLGGAVLFASVKFLSRAEPRANSDSRRYQKTRFSNAHRTVAADSEFHVPIACSVLRVRVPSTSAIYLIPERIPY
jgi:hypothetical protein